MKHKKKYFKLDLRSLNQLKKDGLPIELIMTLAILANAEYKSEKEFINSLELLLGVEYLAQYKTQILKRAQRSANPSHQKNKRFPKYHNIHRKIEAPAGLSTQPVDTVPILELSPQDIQNLISELEKYHKIYSPFFRRREQQEASLDYLNGLLSDVPSKSIESIILTLKGDDPNAIRAMQNFISKGSWDDEAILARHRKEVDLDLGDENGVVIADGSDFPKQGKDSAGVKRQMCGELGKRANCQAGVFLGYASDKGFTLLDRRLYLPEEWFSDDFAERRKKCGIPEEIEFKTKNQQTLEMFQALNDAGTLRFRWFVCDEAFGRDTKFLDDIATMVSYFAEVPCDTRVWLERPATYVPEWSGKGRKPTREQLQEEEPASQTVENIASNLPPEAWSTHVIKEGTKGPIVADFACLRIVASRDGLPGPGVWLVLRNNIKSGELKYYLSNAPVDTSLGTFVWLSGMRWPIETCFKQGKQELGMGDYQVRSWTGWNHHMTLCILARSFLVRIQLKLGNNAPALTLEQTVMLMRVVLPRQKFDAEWVLEVLNYRQRNNHAAYLSHRKKQLAWLNCLKTAT